MTGFRDRAVLQAGIPDGETTARGATHMDLAAG